MVSQKMKLKILEKNNQPNNKIPGKWSSFLEQYLPNLKNTKYEIWNVLFIVGHKSFLTI